MLLLGFFRFCNSLCTLRLEHVSKAVQLIMCAACQDLGRHSDNMPIKGASGGGADDVIRAALWVARPSDSWHKQFTSGGNQHKLERC